MLMVHGRGAQAQDILSLADQFTQPRFAYLALQAAGNTWYPNRFLVPLEENEPWLSSALEFVGGVKEQIYGHMPNKGPDTPYLGLYFYILEVSGCKQGG